jgi:hypothetical protein
MQPKWPIAGIETPTPPPSSGTGAKSAKIVNRHGPTALLRPTTEFYVDGRYHTRIAFMKDSAGKVSGAVLNPGRWEQKGIRID